jgi:hypothetical protein
MKQGLGAVASGVKRRPGGNLIGDVGCRKKCRAIVGNRLNDAGEFSGTALW